MNSRTNSVHGWPVCKLPGSSPPVNRADLYDEDVLAWIALEAADQAREEQSRSERWTPEQRRKVAEVRSRIVHNPTMAEALRRAGIA